MLRTLLTASMFATACASHAPRPAPDPAPQVAKPVEPPPTPTETTTAPEPSASVEEGAKLYDDNGCGVCHTVDGTPKRGPTMRGYVGASFVLANGTKVVGSEERFLKSFVHAQPLQGFESSMPSYAEVIDEHDRHALFAYVNSLH